MSALNLFLFCFLSSLTFSYSDFRFFWLILQPTRFSLRFLYRILVFFIAFSILYPAFPDCLLYYIVLFWLRFLYWGPLPLIAFAILNPTSLTDSLFSLLLLFIVLSSIFNILYPYFPSVLAHAPNVIDIHIRHFVFLSPPIAHSCVQWTIFVWPLMMA